MTGQRAAVITYGCQMNKHDSERIAGILRSQGYTLVEDPLEADLVLLNTCSIREKAEQKVFSQLGRLKGLKRDKPGMLIGVAGCIAQQEGSRIIERVPQVDMVFGTNNIDALPQLLQRARRGHKVSETAEDDSYFGQVACIERDSKVTAWVEVMRGCNNFCSYCVVPYTRGHERSKPARMVEEEVKVLAGQGYKEVTLLGQNVNSYGDSSEENLDFPGLLERVNAVPGIQRVRFLTSHPKDLSERLIEAMASLEKVCPHIHLPLQSGSDRILDLMNRKYTSADYLERVMRLREAVHGVAISTDIIVGFPGESMGDYIFTRDMLQQVQFDNIYLFKYSSRPGTRASLLEGTVPQREKDARFDELIAIQKEIILSKNRALEGRIEEVLVEGISKTDSAKNTGRTVTNKIVNFPISNSRQGDLIEVRIRRGGLYSLEGTIEV